MPILQKRISEYTIPLDGIKELIASDMKLPVEAISIHYVIQEVGGDFMDRFPGTPTVTCIKVTVDETKVKQSETEYKPSHS